MSAPLAPPALHLHLSQPHTDNFRYNNTPRKCLKSAFNLLKQITVQRSAKGLHCSASALSDLQLWRSIHIHSSREQLQEILQAQKLISNSLVKFPGSQHRRWDPSIEYFQDMISNLLDLTTTNWALREAAGKLPCNLIFPGSITARTWEGCCEKRTAAKGLNLPTHPPSAIPWGLGENDTTDISPLAISGFTGTAQHMGGSQILLTFPSEIITTSVLPILCTPLRGWSWHLTYYWSHIRRLELEL